MEEEKFNPVGGSSDKEPKGFKVKVITILIVILIIILAIVCISNIKENRKRALNENLATATVMYELNRIKIGDETAIEKYLNYSELLNNSEDIEEAVEEVNTQKEDEDKASSKKEESDSEKVEKEEGNKETTKATEDLDKNEEEIDEDNEDADVEDLDDEDNEIEELEKTDDNNENIIKQLLSTLNYEVKGVEIDGDNAIVEVSITNKNSGEIFSRYFTRAIKLTINNTISVKKGDYEKISQQLDEYLEEQIVSNEIPTVTNEVKFYLEKNDEDWEVKSVEKDLTNIVLPDLVETINNYAETYGEYGD